MSDGSATKAAVNAVFVNSDESIDLIHMFTVKRT